MPTLEDRLKGTQMSLDLANGTIDALRSQLQAEQAKVERLREAAVLACLIATKGTAKIWPDKALAAVTSALSGGLKDAGYTQYQYDQPQNQNSEDTDG